MPALRTLILDRRGTPSRDCVRSLEDAVARLISDEYDTIILHSSAGRDDFGLVEYLAATWPAYMQSLKVQSVSAGVTYVWDPAARRFIRQRSKGRRAYASAVAQRGGEQSSVS